MDLGLAGDEWLMETGHTPDRRCFEARSYEASVCLLMARGRSPPARRIRSVATPYPNLARRACCAGPRRTAGSSPVSGSSEALVPDVADACLDLVETGTSAA